jgi:hypothetical protein
MATHRNTTSTVARCPYCCWSKLIFGTDKRQLQLQAAHETVAHRLTFRIPPVPASPPRHCSTS